MTPAQRHRARVLAQVSASAVAGGSVRGGAAATEYQLQRARLGVDLRRLKEIQSIERKIELKRELLPAYDPWIEGVLAADAGGEDDIVTWIMMWMIDINAVHSAMPLIRYVLKHGLVLPERFDRTAPTLIAEEIAESALKRLGQEPPLDAGDASAMTRLLDETAELVVEKDIYDQVRAKLEKAQGLAALAVAAVTEPGADGPAGSLAGAQERAITHLDRALALDPKAGVKQTRDRLKRERDKAALAATETTQ